MMLNELSSTIRILGLVSLMQSQDMLISIRDGSNIALLIVKSEI